MSVQPEPSGDRISALLSRGDADGALAHARQAIAAAPADANLAMSLAAQFEAYGRTDAACEILQRLLASGKPTAPVVMLYSRMSPGLGCEGEALQAVQRMLQGGTELSPAERSSLHFCAAFLLDRAGRYDEAFEQASRAHALRNASYEPAWIERLVRDFTGYFTPDRLRRLPRAAHGSRLPVFVVGMPRSGTTLVEQILASHPSVFGAGELTWVFQLWQSAVRRRSHPMAGLIECVDRLTATDVEELAAEYLRPLAALSPQARRVVDKLPMNLLNLGLIAMLFPRSPVIYCRRDPLDTCLSCYLTDLSAGRQFNFDLRFSGHLYRHCEAIMSHWRGVLDLPILDVVYEQVVEDLEGQARRMVDFVGLPWDERCLRFYQTPRPVATASQAQVRRPIYRQSVGRWRHYDRHLAPLRRSLGVPSC